MENEDTASRFAAEELWSAVAAMQVCLSEFGRARPDMAAFIRTLRAAAMVPGISQQGEECLLGAAVALERIEATMAAVDERFGWVKGLQ